MPSGTCALCSQPRRWLHKHHLKYQCDGGTDADGTQLICANCHEDVHEGPMGGKSVAHRRFSLEANERRAAGMRERWKDPVYREKHSGRKAPPDERVRRSKSAKAYWENGGTGAEEHRVRLNASRSMSAAAYLATQAERDDRIKEMRARRMTHKQIAIEIGCHPKTVRNILRRHGLT